MGGRPSRLTGAALRYNGRMDIVVVRLFDSYLLWSRSNATVTDGPHDRTSMRGLLMGGMGWTYEEADEALHGAATHGTSVAHQGAAEVVQGNRAGPYGSELTLRELCARYALEPTSPPGGQFTFTLIIADPARDPQGVDDAMLVSLRSVDCGAPGRTADGHPAITFSRDDADGFIAAVERAAEDVEAYGLVVLHAVREGSDEAPDIIPLHAPVGGAA